MQKQIPVTVLSPAFEKFLAGCVKIYNDYHQKVGFSSKPDHFRFTEGKRYIKVIKDSSAYCFVDKKNGDVLKATSWSAPAKHARGNIFDEHNGLKHIGPYGPAYLR